MNPRKDTTARRGGPDTDRGARLVLDEQGLIAEWNQAARELLGYPAEEVLGRPVARLLAREQPASPAATAGATVTARHRDGHRLDIRARVSALPGEGATVRWCVLLDPAEGTDAEMVDAALLSALLTESPLGVQVLDPELRVVRLNLAGPGLRGAVSQEAIGRRAREVAPGMVDDETERRLRSVVETGRPMTFGHVGRPPADPDHDHSYAVSLLPLKDPTGTIHGVVVASQDVTERQQAQARLNLLVEAGTRIGTTLDVMTTAEELAEVTAPALADIAAVEVLDDVLTGEAPPPGPVSSEALLRRAGFRAAAGLDATPAYSPGEVIPGYPPSFTACLADLQPRLIRELRVDHEWLVHDPRRAELLRRAGAHSTMVVPLTARGVVLGLASFYRIQTPDPFEEDDLALAVEIGARAAVCLDNARQYTRERSAALTLQRSLLPQTVPVQNAVEVAWRHESTRGSGDWFDVIPLSGARVALVVGHLVGHGTQAAADMGRLRTAINTLATQDPTPDELLAQLHDLASGPTGEHAQLTDDDRAGPHLAGVTCVYAIYDPISRRCTFARAGHPAPVIVYPNGSLEVPDVPAGPPLGSDHPPYETTEVELPVGSTIALSTSSLAPSDHPPEGSARLRRILGNPHRSLKDTCDAIVRERQDRGEESTVLLLARTQSLRADQVSTWTLPNDPALVTTARTLAVRQLAHWNLQELEFTTELIVSELVTNAIRYATGPIQLRLIHDLTLICEVTDDSSTAPHLRHAYETDEGGRGLFLIAQLTRRWGTRYTARGKTIWAEQALPSEL
ncbi:SpoIIE family protein phosphatase [Streptomyces mirabilis]|uniref:SpoIIE family protein phosphatase n=1 Tax=Streptomyces mirabilis TaxID=68239 RepID=UPI00225AA1CC|nr:SpoIIE family protein phosphatase [Streptomyces mirabilis]MCX4437830.1 SpoIIE family protein phosphatase [Streptomyces mirabilis]